MERERGAGLEAVVREEVEVAFEGGGREEGGAGSPSSRASREGRSGVASEGFVMEWRIASEGEREEGAIPARKGREGREGEGRRSEMEFQRF